MDRPTIQLQLVERANDINTTIRIIIVAINIYHGNANANICQLIIQFAIKCVSGGMIKKTKNVNHHFNHQLIYIQFQPFIPL